MKIYIHKFKTIENIEIVIPATISGGNGTGKTTILEAVSFCLTGKNFDGSTFEQVYDNRVELKKAVADVSFFDNYNNEFRRIVKPVYEYNKSGKEVLKTKCSTQCYKNGIEVSDYAKEFSDFLLYGNDYIFNQNESTQREIFINALKKQLPYFDLKSELETLKTLKKHEKSIMDKIKFLNAFIEEILNTKHDCFHKETIYGISRIKQNEIEDKQKELFEASTKVVNQEKKISDFYANLSDSIFQYFSGEIEIRAKLSEYIISKDEFVDCFKLTANGKHFPYECNGALINNVKLQILAGFQKLANYNGITLMDGCEANTSQPINTCGLNTVLTYATFDELLTIK